MGRGETWEHAGDAWQPSDGSSWRGVKYANKHGVVPWQKPKGPKSGDKPKFPAYDAPVPTSKSGGKGTKGQEARETDEGMVSQVQRALNQTRKAEVRLQRLLKDRDKAEAQWQNYVVEAREAFYKEKDRHARALKVFERDIQEAHHQQSDARRVLRDQVLRAEQEADGDAMEEEAVDGEWERMIEAYERESVLADDAVL